MIGKKGKAPEGPGNAWIKSDEIHVDTSRAPWMEFANAELGKKVHELAANDSFVKSLQFALAVDSEMRALERQIDELGKGVLLLGRKGDAWSPDRYRIPTKHLGNPAADVVGRMHADRLKQANPQIDKYFAGLKTDPAYDLKGHSGSIPSVSWAGAHGRITAWCAAFVNWCLAQAGAPQLGYATARSWLGFGTPVAHPVYGCLTIVKPSSSTGSTTGHVAFFVETVGNRVKLLGGNQGGAVTESKFAQSTVLGYRWPTKIDHYRLAGGGVLV